MLEAKARLRDMSVYRVAAASLSHVALYPEVQVALLAWSKLGIKSVLIGGLALSLYAKPRMTEDVDLLFLHDEDVPNAVPGFKQKSPHTLQEDVTHVMLECVTSRTVPIPQELVERVFKTAIMSEGMLVASREGLIALKLYGADLPKRRLNDLADIARIVTPEADMSGWDLSPDHLSAFKLIQQEMA